MIVKSLKYLTIMFSCIKSHDLLITWHRHVNHLIPDIWRLVLDMLSLNTWHLYVISWLHDYHFYEDLTLICTLLRLYSCIMLVPPVIISLLNYH